MVSHKTTKTQTTKPRNTDDSYSAVGCISSNIYYESGKTYASEHVKVHLSFRILKTQWLKKHKQKTKKHRWSLLSRGLQWLLYLLWSGRTCVSEHVNVHLSLRMDEVTAVSRLVRDGFTTKHVLISVVNLGGWLTSLQPPLNWRKIGYPIQAIALNGEAHHSHFLNVQYSF